MTRGTSTLVKFTAFWVVMTVLTTFLFMVFGDYRGGKAASYSAVFDNVSRLEAGDSVRVAGVRVGTVEDVSLRGDQKIEVTFDAPRDVILTTGTVVAVRYLNLVGDRYLELVNGPGSTKILPAGSEIPEDRTRPALDLDLLLGGLRPVLHGLNPEDINALTTSLIEILQGQGGTLTSLLSQTSSFTNAMADKNEIVQQVIDNLGTTVKTLSEDSRPLEATIDRLDDMIAGFSQDRDPVGEAIDALSNGTASLADLLTETRAPLKGTVDQLNRLAPLLANEDMPKVETALQRAPENYRKLIRLGSYGSFINFYLCGVAFRVSDLQGRTAVFPWIKSRGGRCADNG